MRGNEGNKYAALELNDILEKIKQINELLGSDSRQLNVVLYVEKFRRLRINRVMEALVTTSRPLSQILIRSTNPLRFSSMLLVLKEDDEDVDEERQDGEVVDEGLSEEVEDVLKDNNREHLMTGSGSFNVMKQCFSRQGLFPAAKMTTVSVTPDINGVAMDKYIRDSLKYISNNIEPDSLFIATKLLNPNLRNKFAGIFLIDGIFLRGYLKTLINIVGMRTDYRSIPLAHLFTTSHETTKACRIAIQLLKRNVDLDWSAANFMCDQGKGLESAIREEHGKEALTCVTHLSKNLIRNAKGRVIEAFQAATHTVDPQVYEESINELIKKIRESKRDSGNSTFKKLTENPRSFSRLKRDWPHWEIFTTNPVEQFHSFINVLKRGSLVNMIVNLTSFQISCHNRLFLNQHFLKPHQYTFHLLIGSHFELEFPQHPELAANVGE
ncbi:uncharacterized protein NDAI_0K00430 [Naumovozyma dairenensis CBS 421]|uniref:MULE transposase domain-containing protein n=1 Tax=Naumovozyma dairenensis (strain ATCC 10597 / BCRC 20456 / CBS 421 / NBRC 0211 / NRRL Y-12639) TaxID=1071378 RepID=G0WHH3_NAUDC|nr:hypothetical protein NDAI_0K00430 [Naumovozyma dairenensis CBS 421]CCD27234.1 hypothetical protein NDAI_0K00430 [Naumovozyma dairenensis CBS 421]